MIPPRRLGGENYGNGVSYRVAVCRKRLRVSRTVIRAQSSAGDPNEPNRTPRFDGYSSTSPGVAMQLVARQSLSRQTELAATPGSRTLIEGATLCDRQPDRLEAGVAGGFSEGRAEAGPAAPEKAEDR